MRESLQQIERMGAGAGALGGIDDLRILAGDDGQHGAETRFRLVGELQSYLIELEGVVRGIELVIRVVARGIVVGGCQIAGLGDSRAGQHLRQGRGRGVGSQRAAGRGASGGDECHDLNSLQQRLLHWSPSELPRDFGGRPAQASAMPSEFSVKIQKVIWDRSSGSTAIAPARCEAAADHTIRVRRSAGWAGILRRALNPAGMSYFPFGVSPVRHGFQTRQMSYAAKIPSDFIRAELPECRPMATVDSVCAARAGRSMPGCLA